MKRKIQTTLASLAFLISIFYAPFILRAEEGMLIPSVIQAFESDMKARGMKLTAEDIYSVNNASLKDAILHFNGGCTAELVSDRGLLLTNHHCGFSQIQYHSSLQNDYLKYGFWAKSLKEELANPGLYAARMVRIDDVTEAMNFGITSTMSAQEKAEIHKKNGLTLIQDAIRGTHFQADIKPFNYGNDFYIIVREVFNDVRLVGAPPSSVGKFGGDTDNWVWPRHTGDFSVFRVYAGADNKPATYNEANKPYKPLHYLPISMVPRKEGDFTMVYGFPGITEQHLVSGHIKYIIDMERPARIEMRASALKEIDAAMRSSDEVRIQYAAKQARIANAYKKWIGQVDGLVNLEAVKVKQQEEANYLKAAMQKEDRTMYRNLIAEMNQLVERYKNDDYAGALHVEYLSTGPEIFSLARNFYRLEKGLEDGLTGEALEEAKKKLVQSIEYHFKNYNLGLDKAIFKSVTNTFLQLTPPSYLPSELKDQKESALADKIYTKSFLTDVEAAKKVANQLSAKKIKKLKKDPGYALYQSVLSNYVDRIAPKVSAFNGEMEEKLKIYVAGKYAMFPNNKHWADANSTLRITYGSLEGSAPIDGMRYTEHTTTDGILDKHRTGNPDFELLPDLKTLYEKRDFGRYAQDGDLWVCFTGSNHTTGGNSGSPVIDGEGRLMGLNFDRSWESTMSDYMFDPDRCRNIVVDIRYVLWVMDKYAGAGYLVEEMKLSSN